MNKAQSETIAECEITRRKMDFSNDEGHLREDKRCSRELENYKARTLETEFRIRSNVRDSFFLFIYSLTAIQWFSRRVPVVCSAIALHNLVISSYPER
jgi:hypothetical protein